jgi:hypothetical protein
MRGLFEYGYERGRSGKMWWQPSPAEPGELPRGARVAAQ